MHGSTPKYAGSNAANPSAVILSGVMLLRHVGLEEQAARIEQALEASLAADIHTRDVAGSTPVSTTAFADAVIARLDALLPEGAAAAPARRGRLAVPRIDDTPHAPGGRSQVGMDVFEEWDGSPEELGASLEAITNGTVLGLKMISNRGTMVYPSRGITPSLVDHYRCRFVSAQGTEPTDAELLSLLWAIGERHRWMHVERLQRFDGTRGYALAQGEDGE